MMPAPLHTTSEFNKLTNEKNLANIALERAKFRAEVAEEAAARADSGVFVAVVDYSAMSDREVMIKNSKALDRILTAGEARLAIETEKLALFKTAVDWFKRAALVAGGSGISAGGFSLFG